MKRELLKGFLRRLSVRRGRHESNGSRVGLALSSGGARGLAHIGVIQVLEENGIEVDAVAGSSIGGYIAAAWGRGLTGDQMGRFAREVEGYYGALRLMDFNLGLVKGFFETGRIRARLVRTIGDAEFSELDREIRIVATRIDIMDREVFAHGSVVEAVLASIAIPGICVPVRIHGVPYVDGGVSDPLPVEALHQMGIDKVIAVNTIPTPEALRSCGEDPANQVPVAGGSWRALRTRINRAWNPFAPGNAFDTLMRSLNAAQTRLAEASCQRATVVLRPYSCGSRWHDFRNARRYIRLGREVAEAQLSEIKALFPPTPPYEHKPSPQPLVQAA